MSLSISFYEQPIQHSKIYEVSQQMSTGADSICLILEQKLIHKYDLLSTNNYKKHEHSFAQQSFLKLCTKLQNFKTDGQAALV